MTNPKGITRHPIRTIQEGKDVSNAQMANLIKNLGDYAESITIVHSNDDPVIPVQRVNPEVQSLLQLKRRTFETDLRRQLRDGTITPEEAERRRIEQRTTEESEFLIASANKAGHIYFEYPPSVSIPIVSDILDFKETGQHNKPLPNITTDPQWKDSYVTRRELLQKKVERKIRRSLPRLYPFLPIK